MNEDEMSIMLKRIEALAANNAHLKRDASINDNRLSFLREIQQERDRLRRELREAEDKVAEWLIHSESMSRLVPKNRRKEIPPLPKPLETEIPF
jgi:hypothetical protein